MLRVLILFLASVAALIGAPGGWITTWSTAASEPYSDPALMASAHLVFSNQTLRQVIHTSVGSDMVRVRLSNVYNNSAVEIGSAHIAVQTTTSGIDSATDRTLTFDGRTDVTIPPDAVLISDPIPFDVEPATNLAISLFFPNASTNGAAIHYSAIQTSYLGAGNRRREIDH